MPHNILRILVEGAGRAELCGLEDGEYLEADVCEIPDIVEEGLPEEAMLRNLQDIFEGYTAASGKMNKDMARQIENCQTVQNMMEQISIHVPFRWEEHQQYLETVNFEERYELLCVLLNNEIEIEKFRRGIQEKVKARVDKQQKDYILREQLKVIREELGDDGPNTEAAAFREEVKKLEASEEVKERIEKEIQRFLNSGANSAEAGVIRGYIETLLALPWDKRSEDRLDLRKAEEILEEEHYGLEKVKERILEFLAVRKMMNAKESPILCLVGPPGTGKTSIARSIAPWHWIKNMYASVWAAFEMRRRSADTVSTYVGAMPGRIADGLKTAGVKNPLMLLDEIDKVSSDYKGDTFSALAGGSGQ